MPMSSARTPGTPLLAARLAMTSMDRMAIAPTDRSMPAVRMISVCPIASAAITATCCRMMPMVSGAMKRGLMIVNTMTEMISTNNGLIEGWACRTMLDSLQWRLLAQRELLCSGMWCLRFDCCCHVASLRKRHPVFARGNVLAPPTVGWLRH